MGIHVCHIMFGILGGVIFSLLFINVDKTWKRWSSILLTALFESIASAVTMYKGIGITNLNTIFWAISWMIFSFLLSYIVMMFVIAFLLKEKDNNDILRIRDILLGQKKYINRYYEQRHNEVTTKIIPDLEERQQRLERLQATLDSYKEFLESEFRKLDEMGAKKPRIELPDHKKVIVTKDYLDSFPSYVTDLSTCINDINIITQELIDKNADGNLTLTELKSYLLDIALHISKDLFKSNEVRIHFRYLDEITQSYKVFVSIRGAQAVDRDMTSIPFESNNLIKQSCKCRRALIKSLNSEACFTANNFTTWQDFMTFAFYNIKKDEKVCLSFGISVRNKARYQALLYFLNHINFESFLQENIEKINQQYNITNVLYQS